MSDWLRIEMGTAIILALGHFLWQGALIALLAAFALWTTDSPQRRYRWALAGLLAMSICPLLTIVWRLNSNQDRSQVVERSLDAVDSSVPSAGLSGGPTNDLVFSGDGSSTSLSLTESQPVDASLPATWMPNVRLDWRRFVPPLLGLYVIGAAMMFLRLLVGLWGGRILRSRSVLLTDSRILSAAERQTRALGLKCQPMLAYCERVAVPTVVGLFRPVILLPITLTSGLTPQQIDSILAHELAHLARYDHVVNVLQRVIEALLFFHPAVWWLSQRIRQEREICCDCLVLANGADPLDYARSLLNVAEMSRSTSLNPAVAAVSLLATGGRPSALRQRIAGILGEPATPSLRLNSRSLLIAIGIPFVAMLVALRTNATNHITPTSSVNGQVDEVHTESQKASEQPISSDSWPVFRGNAESQGVSQSKLPEHLEILWELKVVNGAFESTPAIVDRRVYLGDTDGEVYCFDLDSGKTVWESESESSFVASPAYRDGILVIGDTDGKVHALDASNGKSIWEFTSEGPIQSGANFYGAVALVSSEDGTLYALKLKTGELVWKYATGDQLRGTPTISGKLALLGGCDGSLHVVDLETGKAAGEKVPLGGPTGSTPAVLGDLVVVPTHGGPILGINSVTRSVNWTFSDASKSREVNSSPAVYGGLALISTQNRRLLALDTKDGSLRWEAVLRNRSNSSPVVCDGRVYVAASGRLYVFELETGRRISAVQLVGEISGSPAIANGRLVIASSKGAVYCLGPLEAKKNFRISDFEIEPY